MLLELYIIAVILNISGKFNNYNIKNHPLDIRVKRNAQFEVEIEDNAIGPNNINNIEDKETLNSEIKYFNIRNVEESKTDQVKDQGKGKENSQYKVKVPTLSYKYRNENLKPEESDTKFNEENLTIKESDTSIFNQKELTIDQFNKEISSNHDKKPGDIIIKSLFHRKKRNVTHERFHNGYYTNWNAFSFNYTRYAKPFNQLNSNQVTNLTYNTNRTNNQNNYTNINFAANKITAKSFPNNGYNQPVNPTYQPINPYRTNLLNKNQNIANNYYNPINNYKYPYNNQFYYPYQSNNPTNYYNQNQYNVNSYENNLLNSGITVTSTENVPETTTSTTAPVILESCVLCRSIGCPSFFKRIGFLCVDPNKMN